MFRIISGLALAAALSGCRQAPPEAKFTSLERQCGGIAARLMKVPESFKIVEAFTVDDGVMIDARSQNAYGTAVKTSVRCERDPSAPDTFTGMTIDGAPVDPYAMVAASYQETLARVRSTDPDEISGK